MGKEWKAIPYRTLQNSGVCLSAHPPSMQKSCFSQEGLQPALKKKKYIKTKVNCDAGKQRRPFSLEIAVFNLKELDPSLFLVCKQKNSACGSQVHPKVGSSGIWAALTATQICHCCSPGGVEREPPGKQGTEPEERLTDLVSDQMDGSK